MKTRFKGPKTSLVGILLLTISSPMSPESALSQMTPTRLRTEYAVNPVGIDAPRPRLSWGLLSDSRGAMQSAYRIQVASSVEALDAGTDLIWDSGKVDSDQSIHVEYWGPALSSGQRCYWRVRVWDESGHSEGWSRPAFWEMGLLDTGDWRADWITPHVDENPDTPQPAWMYRTEFRLDGSVESARAYVTSLGLYEMELNGEVVGDQVFTPGWTSYGHRLQYQVYDVTESLTEGDNAVGVTVGDGWYRGFLAFGGRRNLYGDRAALLLQITDRTPELHRRCHRFLGFILSGRPAQQTQGQPDIFLDLSSKQWCCSAVFRVCRNLYLGNFGSPLGTLFHHSLF